MVGLDQADELRYQGWMTQRMQRLLASREVQEALRELMDLLEKMGMNRERIEQLQKLIRQIFKGCRRSSTSLQANELQRI